jgi:RimJ/RimL family protein N-acetyltransferase
MIVGMGIHRPPEEIAGSRVVLRRYRYPDDTPMVLAALQASFDHLRGWMPWAQSPPTEESVRDFVTHAASDFGADSSANYAITLRHRGTFVGGCGLHPRVGKNALEIGYWIDIRFARRGLVTEAVHLLTDAALGLDGVTHVEIHCDEANVRSAAVPARLGYRLNRIEADEIEAPNEVGRSMVWIAAAR